MADRVYFSTGSKALDTLLGSKGLRHGSTVLLRGAPGTGKTTLSLQLGKAFLSEPDRSVLFLGVEEPPLVAFELITKSIWDRALTEYFGDAPDSDPRWRAVDMTEYWNRLTKDVDVHLRQAGAQRSELSNLYDIESPTIRREVEAENKVRLADMHEPLQQLWVETFATSAANDRLIVIDSLDALIHGAQVRFRRRDQRWMLLAVLNSLHAWRRGAMDRDGRIGAQTILLIAEEGVGAATLAAESYVADVVIQLRRERRVQRIPVAPEQYAEWTDDLSFCEVLKGRGLPIQRRSCCYEFRAVQASGSAAGEFGVHFLPTYAAQALVCLFQENTPQRQVIETLRNVDVPATYPGVIVQEVERSGQQSLFSVRRYATQVPRRHPLLLSNIDEYWVRVLARQGLLQPIDARALRLHSMDPVADDGSLNQPIVRELVEAKGHHYMASHLRYQAVPQWINLGMLIYRKDLLEDIGVFEPPETWEELESIAARLQARKKPHQLLLETRTYDTLVTTVLELGWSFGSLWRTSTDESTSECKIHFEHGSVSDFVAAIERLHRWIHKDGLVPVGCSVDPDHHPQNDWAFARHWYSTWVDVCTKRDSRGCLVAPLAGDGQYAVAPLPVAQRYRERCGEARHHSAWGEWYLAIQSGSENIEMGLELINNLMTSRHISERARSGAGLPVTEQFYRVHGQDICFCTNLTFDQIRKRFFVNARSRADFDEYRVVARVLHGAVRAVVSNPDSAVAPLIARAFEELTSHVARRS